ncbi:MAG: hypothetical protein QXL31_05845 [Thermosphaera sp.]
MAVPEPRKPRFFPFFPLLSPLFPKRIFRAISSRAISYIMSALIVTLISIAIVAMTAVVIMPQIQAHRSPKIEVSAELVYVAQDRALVRFSVMNVGAAPVQLREVSVVGKCSRAYNVDIAPGQAYGDAFLCSSSFGLLEKNIIVAKAIDIGTGWEVAAQTWALVRG